MHEIRTPSRRVERQIAALPMSVQARVGAAVLALAGEPRPAGAIRLSGGDGTEWRVRVGDYRIIYEIDDPRRVVTVLRVRHRRDVYRSR